MIVMTVGQISQMETSITRTPMVTGWEIQQSHSKPVKCQKTTLEMTMTVTILTQKSVGKIITSKTPMEMDLDHLLIMIHSV